VRDDRGFAVVEVILLGLLLLIPLMWLLGVLADLHRGALASTAAAKEAGVSAARASDPAGMDAAVDRAVAQAFRDHGLDPRRAEVQVRAGGGVRGAAVEVVVGYDVTVLQVPFIGRVSGPSIGVTAKHVARIDPYASRP
jgi:hypothetical protein